MPDLPPNSPKEEIKISSSPTLGLPKPGTGKWAGAVVTLSPETLPATAGFVLALAAAAVRGVYYYQGSTGNNGLSSDLAAPLALITWPILTVAWVASMVGALPAVKVAVDKAVPQASLFAGLDVLYATEGFGMACFVGGCAFGGWLGLAVATLGALCTTQVGQLVRLQSKTTGVASGKAVDTAHLLCLTTSAFAHHLASFAVLPNGWTALFVLSWRFVSISGHALSYLRAKQDAPPWVLHALGWGRYVLCVGTFQPLLLLAVWAALWRPASAPDLYLVVLEHACSEDPGSAAALLQITASSASTACGGALLRLPLSVLGRGLAENFMGHVTYMLFRFMRLEDQRRDRLANGLENIGIKYGRQPGLLEFEMALLATGSFAFLLAP
jgi:hypothetical protein